MNGQLRSPSAESPPSSRNARGAAKARSSWCSWREARAADFLAEVPRVVPVGEPGPDAAFAAHGHAGPARPRRPDRAPPWPRANGRPRRVASHRRPGDPPGCPAATTASKSILAMPLDRGCRAWKRGTSVLVEIGEVVGPEEVPRAKGDVAALGQVAARRPSPTAPPRPAGSRIERVDRWVQDDRRPAGALAAFAGRSRYASVGQARLDLVADPLPDDPLGPVLLDRRCNAGGLSALHLQRHEEIEPEAADLLTPSSPRPPRS